MGAKSMLDRKITRRDTLWFAMPTASTLVFSGTWIRPRPHLALSRWRHGIFPSLDFHRKVNAFPQPLQLLDGTTRLHGIFRPVLVIPPQKARRPSVRGCSLIPISDSVRCQCRGFVGFNAGLYGIR